MINTPIPMVVENSEQGPRGWDIFSRLIKDRVIMLSTPIDDMVSNVIVAQLLYLQSEDPSADIDMYINSPGGTVSAGMAIYDTMQILGCDIKTYGIGQAASMGALLLAAGAPGKRFVMPNARVMIHQPLGGAAGQATDIEIHTKEILRIKDDLNKIMVKHTGQTMKKVKHDSDRDFFMSAEEAKKYGIVDEVLTNLK